jgi:hypothetical protein
MTSEEKIIALARPARAAYLLEVLRRSLISKREKGLTVAVKSANVTVM